MPRSEDAGRGQMPRPQDCTSPINTAAVFIRCTIVPLSAFKCVIFHFCRPASPSSNNCFKQFTCKNIRSGSRIYERGWLLARLGKHILFLTPVQFPCTYFLFQCVYFYFLPNVVGEGGEPPNPPPPPKSTPEYLDII